MRTVAVENGVVFSCGAVSRPGSLKALNELVNRALGLSLQGHFANKSPCFVLVTGFYVYLTNDYLLIMMYTLTKAKGEPQLRLASLSEDSPLPWHFE